MIIIRKELCPQNHPCPTINICPVDALTQQGYDAPEVDEDKCILCGKCTKSCGVFICIGCTHDGNDKRAVPMK